MEIPIQVLQMASGYAVKFVAEEIRGMGRKELSTASPDNAQDSHSHTEPVRGCPVCAIHNSASTAKGHLDGIVDVGNTRGTIPDVMRPEVLLAAKDLSEAQSTLDTVRQRAPSLSERCDRVNSAIDRARAIIPEPDALDLTTASNLRDALSIVHQEATLLGVEYYELERGNTDSDALRKWYDNARQNNLDADTALSKLREVLNDD